jgi:hypothetical protein
VDRSAYGGASASYTTMAALAADKVKSSNVFMVFPSRTIRTRTIAWHVSRGESQSLNRGCLNALYMRLSGLECKKGDKQSVVTGSLQSLNSDYKVPYTVVPFLYQYFTRETYISKVWDWWAYDPRLRVEQKRSKARNCAEMASRLGSCRRPVHIGR